MFVKPGPNPDKPSSLLKVRVPRTHTLLPDEGAEVPEDMFWLQRLSQGDVVLVKSEEPAAEEKHEDDTATTEGDHPAEAALPSPEKVA